LQDRLARSTHVLVEEIWRAAHHSRFQKLHNRTAQVSCRGSDSCTDVPCVALASNVRSFQAPQLRQRSAKRTLASTCEPRWKPSTTNVPGSPRIRSRRFDSCWFWMFVWPTLTITSPALTCIRTRDVRCLRRVPLGATCTGARNICPDPPERAPVESKQQLGSHRTSEATGPHHAAAPCRAALDDLLDDDLPGASGVHVSHSRRGTRGLAIPQEHARNACEGARHAQLRDRNLRGLVLRGHEEQPDAGARCQPRLVSAGAAREKLVRARRARGEVGRQLWACACDGGS